MRRCLFDSGGSELSTTAGGSPEENLALRLRSITFQRLTHQELYSFFKFYIYLMELERDIRGKESHWLNRTVLYYKQTRQQL